MRKVHEPTLKDISERWHTTSKWRRGVVMVILRCGGCRSLPSLLILYTCVHSRVASHFEKSCHAEIARVENVHYLQVVLWPVARQQAIEVDCSRFNLSHFFWGRFGKTSQDEKAFKMEFEVWSLIISPGKNPRKNRSNLWSHFCAKFFPFFRWSGMWKFTVSNGNTHLQRVHFPLCQIGGSFVRFFFFWMFTPKLADGRRTTCIVQKHFEVQASAV